MTKHVFNSDSSLKGIFGGKKFEIFFWKLFYLMNEIFDRCPFEELNIKFFQTKKKIINHNVDFDIPKYLIHEISFNIVPIAIYTPICTIY